MKKVILIVLGILILLGAGFLYLVKKQLGPDQVTLQYKKEKISDDKKALNFETFELTKFDKYDLVNKYAKEQPIEKIQEGLKDGQFTLVELCQYYLTRIENHQDYNAVIQLNDEILKEAALADERIANGEFLPLTGVVVLVKDNIAAEGMNTSAGSYVLKDLTTSRDATIVKALKDKGALIIGKANLSEFSNYMSTPSSSGFSTLGGQTKNAYGIYDVGGSSSGSSVATALDLATVTLGTETAGSLIFPAGQNSVVALKPTMGLLSRDLIIPIAEAQDTAGVESKFVKDLEKVFHEILVDDINDPASSIVKDYDKTVDFENATLSGLKFAVVGQPTGYLENIAASIKSAGGIIVEKEMKQVEQEVLTVFRHGIQYDLNAFLQNEAVNTDYKSLDEIVTFYKANPEKAPYGIYFLEDGLKADANVDAIIENNRTSTRAALDDLLQDVDVILSVSNELSGIYAAAGYPAITVPSGYSESGEPFGVTFVGGYLQDNKLIEIGYAYEQYTQGRKAVE